MDPKKKLIFMVSFGAVLVWITATDPDFTNITTLDGVFFLVLALVNVLHFGTHYTTPNVPRSISSAAFALMMGILGFAGFDILTITMPLVYLALVLGIIGVGAEVYAAYSRMKSEADEDPKNNEPTTLSG